MLHSEQKSGFSSFFFRRHFLGCLAVLALGACCSAFVFEVWKGSFCVSIELCGVLVLYWMGLDLMLGSTVLGKQMSVGSMYIWLGYVALL